MEELGATGPANKRATTIEEYVTRFGRWRKFRDRPLPGEEGLSVIMGKLLPREAAPLVKSGKPVNTGDAVRHARVACLEEAGFVIVADPLPLNDRHALIRRESPWTEEAAAAFDDCFDKPIMER